jgi:hypothetical protein
MRPKVERIARSLTDILASWESVECVALCEQSEGDVLDPYFALVLDVYHRASVPPLEERKKAFGDPGAFESAQVQAKDRFFLEGLPVRIEYKSIESIEQFVSRGSEYLWILQNSGTYIFYRLATATVLWQRSDWMDGVKRRLGELSPAFWSGLREAFQAKMEHHLADLGAAAYQDDGFFYLVSMGGFLRYAAATLLMINKRFEPSHRGIEAHLNALPQLPDDFQGRWETLVRSDASMSREQKYKVAELLARSIVALQ